MRTSSTLQRLTIVAAAIVVVGVVSWAAISSITAASAPTGLTASAGDTQVTLTWNNPNDSTITGYQVLQVAIDKLTGSTSATGDRFGKSVGVDNNWAVVGAPLEDTTDGVNAITDSGLVHVFKRSSGNWNSELTPSYTGAARDDEIGASVAVSGGTVVFGVPKYDHEVSNNPADDLVDIGRFFVYLDPPGSALGWGTPHDARGGSAGDWFGTSVAIDGGTAIVGAPMVQVGAHQFAGKAYVHTENSNGSWSRKATLDADTNAGLGYAFGTAVAVDGSTAVVGAFGDDSGKGAVYVFTQNGNAWPRAARLTAPNAANDDSFGRSVAVDGDFVVVGSWRDDDGGTNSGSVYVFTKPTSANGWGAWGGLSSTAKDALTAKLTASDAAAEDHFGWSVAIDGDNVVVGAHGNDDDGTDSGSAYLFTKPSGGWATATETVKLTAPDGAAGDEFGYSVAAGRDRAIVGAPGDESDTGAAYVFGIAWTDISGSGSGTTSHTATGLTNGVEHTFLIRPVVDGNPGPTSGTTKATPQQSPAATPTGLSALGGDAQVTLSWNDPNDSTITGYEFQQKEGSGTFGSWMTILTSGYGQANTTGYTVTGLDNGKTYTFRIRAVDEAGDSTASNQGSASTLPAAPASLMATASDRQVTLSWDDPDNNSITIYQYSTDGGSNFAEISGSSATTTNYTVTVLSDGTNTALVNGSTYTFAVRAVNNTGNGAASTLTVAMVPPAPTGLTVTGGDGQVALLWNDPNDTGITGYQYSTDDGTNYTAFALAAIDSSEAGKFKYTIKNLPNGVTYNLALRAVNASGNGGVATATALMVPASPVNLTAMPLDMQVQLSWDDPANTTITKYELLQLAEESGLIASDAAKNDRFGVSVAVDDDTAVVGAFQPTYTDPDTSLDVSRPGAAYVYTKDSNGAWSQQAKLTASNGAAGDEFGVSVAVDGDTVVVGARGNVSKTGAIYVFTKPSDGDWTSTITETKLTATGGAANDLFGASVALYGESTLVVGAPGDQNSVGGTDVSTGSAYVFTLNSETGEWSQNAKLTASNAGADDLFGNSVAVDDDTIAVGAYGKDGNSLTDSGLVYVFVKPEADGGWANASTETVQLRASDRAANDNFGRSVAVDTDTIVVGASGDRNTVAGTELSTGSAYVFTRPDNGWVANSVVTETAKLTASDGAHTDQFGRSVAVDGDTIVVGAHQNDDDGSDSGSIYVFIKPTDGWEDSTGTVKLTASNGKAGDRFGIALALDGDTALVAAPRNDANDDDDDTGNDVLDAGSAYVFEIKGWTDIPENDANNTYHEVTDLTNNVTYTFKVRAVNPSGDGVASTVTETPMPVPAAPVILSATPSDGQVALTWSNPGDDTITKYQYSTDYVINGGGNGNNGGATFDDIQDSDADTTAYTVTGLANGTTHTLAVRAVNKYGDGMPSAVTALMIPAAPKLSAAPGDTEVALSWPDPGNATITKYQLWQHAEIAKLVEGDGAATNDVFGNAVAVDGNTAVIGVPGDVNNSVRTGAAFVFTKGPNGWSRAAKLIAKDPEEGDQFGFSVALDGDTIVVGVLQDDLTTGETDGTAAPRAGSAYVFSKPTGGWVNWDGLTDTAKDGLTAKLIAGDAAAGDEFGRSVAVDESTGTVVVGAWRHGVNDTEGAAYVFTKDSTGWSQTAKLTHSTSNADDFFGHSVAVDGSTVLIGVEGDNGEVTDSGAAYVFTKPASAGGWGAWDNLPQTDDAEEDKDGLTAKLAASDGRRNDFFGASVAMDGNTAVIGAEGLEWVYVFIKESEGWVEKAKLSSDDPDHDGRRNNFGNSVAVDGDIVVVGADGVDQSDTVNNTGAAYVFTKPATGWADSNDATKLTASDAAANDKFGGAVAVDGSTVLVGAERNDGDKGAAYVLDIGDWANISNSNSTTTSHSVLNLTNYQEYWFRIRAANASGAGPASNIASATPRIGKPAKPTGLTARAGNAQVTLNWDNPNNSTIDKYQISEVIPEDFLTASVAAAGDHFGISVAIDGNTAVVGADRANNRKGSAYIFTRDSSGDWTQQAKLDGENDGDQFGWSVAVEGDTVVVGAHAYDGEDAEGDDLINSGAAYVISEPSGGWGAWDALSSTAKAALTATLTPDYPEAYAFFGGSVALDGSTLAIGSRLYDAEDFLGSGAAYVFTKDSVTGMWSQAAKLTASTSRQLAYLGYSLAVDGDTVLVGAYGDDTVFGELGSGSAYVFTKPNSSGGWTDWDPAVDTETAKLVASDRQPSGYFGFSVALDGDTAVIGARQHNDPKAGAGSGAAYVFTRESGVWGEKAKLTASDAAAGDNFGMSVAVEGDSVVVGSWQDDDNGRNSGSAYVFEKPALGWARTFETLKLNAPDGSVNDRFGWSVAVDLDDVRGDLALVGAYSDDIAAALDAGSVHVLGIPNWVDIGGSDDATISLTVTKELDDPDTDLSNGTEYAFQVRALNRSGAGPASDGVSATPLGPPSDLRGLMSEDGDTQVRLYWNAPAEDSARAPITRYEYQYQEKHTNGNVGARDDNWEKIPDSGPATTEYMKTELVNKAYTFRVRAVNMIGESPASTVDATPTGVPPAAPTSLAAAVGDTQVRLTWNDPNDSSIDKYILSTDDTTYTDIDLQDLDYGVADKFRYAVTDLTNGTEYTFYIRAVDNPEQSNAATVTATPMASEPATPENLKAKGLDSKVELTWDDPDDSSIDRYEYQWTGANGTSSWGEAGSSDDWIEVQKKGLGRATAHQDTVTGLTNGVLYTFVIRAVDTQHLADPFSAKSGEASATPLPNRPRAPTNLNVTARNQEVTLTWRAPPSSVVDKYEVLHLQASELAPVNVVEDDKFGYSVAVDGDIAVVGAYQDDSDEPNGIVDSGAAYVFTRSGGVVWDEGVKLTASDGAPYDNFGISVAVDDNTIVIGASGDDDNGADSGSVYVFTRDPYSGVWSQAAKLTASDGEALGYFGQSVAVSGDTVLVGAYQDDDEGNDLEDSGSVYVFTKPTSEGGWSDWNDLPQTATNENYDDKDRLTAKLTASDAADDDNFGTSVALDGDTAVIGAPGDDDNGIDSGSVYVFVKPLNGWATTSTHTAKLTDRGGAAGDSFGVSVAVDGVTAVVGAHQHDDKGIDSGSAYVFMKPSGTAWITTSTWTAKLTADDGEAFDYFGYSVAVDGDTAAVGAYQDDDKGADSGSVYVFTKDSETGTWRQTNKLTEDPGEADGWFGYSVAVDAGAHTALIGAGSAHVMDVHDWEEVSASGLVITHTIANLTNNRQYDFQVRAVNLAGAGAQAEEEATPLLTVYTPPPNALPRFEEGNRTTRTVPENAEAGTPVGGPVTATDQDNDQLEYSLSGTGQASFDVDSRTAQITTKTLLDYEVENEYWVRLRVRDGEGGIGIIDVTITIEDVGPPSQPGVPEISSTGPTGLVISWTAPDNQGPGITHYDVQYREAGGEFQDAGYDGVSTSLTLNDLEPETGYEVQVRAITDEGASLWSESGRGQTEEPPPPPRPEPTPAPTPEPTPAPTPEPTPAPTPEPTPAPTPDPTPAPTPDPTPAPTPDPTRAPTPDPTRAPTPEATVTPTPEATITPTPEPTATPTPMPEPTVTPTTEPEEASTLAPGPSRTPAPVPTSTTAPAPTATVGPVPPGADGGERAFPWWAIVSGGIGVVGVILLILSRRRRRR